MLEGWLPYRRFQTLDTTLATSSIGAGPAPGGLLFFPVASALANPNYTTHKQAILTIDLLVAERASRVMHQMDPSHAHKTTVL